MAQINYLYQDFLREKVDKEYLHFGKYCAVLGENFVDDNYILLYENLNRYYLVVENNKNPLVVEIKVTRDEYLKFNKFRLKNVIPKDSFDSLLKRGLYKSYESGVNDKNNQTTIHRLNMCLYQNILDLEVHHNNKNKKDNVITNLTPLEPAIHDELDMLKGIDFERYTRFYHNKFKAKFYALKRNTLASRDEVILDVLVSLYKGKSVKEIVKQSKFKISKSKVYEIKRHYFYLDEFIEYLKNTVANRLQSFDGNLDKKWNYIKEFQTYKAFKTDEYGDFLKLMEGVLYKDKNLSISPRASPIIRV